MILKVANLSLYAVALAVFNSSKPHTLIDVENQVWWCEEVFLAFSFLSYGHPCHIIPEWAVPLDCIFVHYYRMLLCGHFSPRNKRTKVCRNFLILSFQSLRRFLEMITVIIYLPFPDWKKGFMEKVMQGFHGRIGSEKFYTIKLP